MMYDAATALQIDTTAFCDVPDPLRPKYHHRSHDKETMRQARNECAIMDALREGPKAQAQIAAELGIARSTVSLALKRMQDKEVQTVRVIRRGNNAWYALT